MFLVVTKARFHGVIALDGVPSEDFSREIFVIFCKLSGSEPNVEVAWIVIIFCKVNNPKTFYRPPQQRLKYSYC